MHRRRIAAAEQLFLFQILEKTFHDSIVMGMTLGGEGLKHPQMADGFAGVFGGKLSTLISMEHDTLGDTAQSDRIPQGVNGQEVIKFVSNTAGDDFSGIEVQNGADVMELSTNFYIGKVADPDQIRCFLVKSLREKTLTHAGILFAYRRSFLAASSVSSAGIPDLR